MKIEPLGDRVLIQPLEEQETKSSGGIIIPDTAKEKPQMGVVKAVGKGKRKDDGTLISPSVKEEDRVYYSKYGGTEVKLGNETYLIMQESDILGLIKG